MHQKIYSYIGDWLGMTVEELREYERKAALELDERIAAILEKKKKQ